MKVIRELIFFLNQKNINPFGKTEAKTKVFALYTGILKGSYKEDEDAIAGLYNCTGGEANYRKLKFDLRERLLSLVLDIDVSKGDFSDYQMAYFYCHRRWITFRTLVEFNADHAALSIASKLLREVIRFDFTLMVMDITAYMRIQYGLREPNGKKFNAHNRVFEQYSALFHAENQAEGMYATLMVKLVNGRPSQKDLLQQADQYLAELAPMAASMESYRLQLYYYLIGIMKATNTGDHKQALSICKQAIVFFDNRPYQARVPLQIFYYQRLLVDIQLKQFEDGELAASYCMRFVEPGTFNWFKFKDLYLKLTLHSGGFDQSYAVLEEALNHPQFESLPENAKEIWHIYEAYVLWLCQMGNIPSVTAAKKFKIYKFLNETSIFSKDKKGMNIAILIIKFLWMLQEGRLNQLLDEVSVLEQYCYRHLRGKDEKRSYAFIKLLLLIPMNRFDMQAVKGKASPYLKHIFNDAEKDGQVLNDLEIIPYETLWQMLLVPHPAVNS